LKKGKEYRNQIIVDLQSFI